MSLEKPRIRAYWPLVAIAVGAAFLSAIWSTWTVHEAQDRAMEELTIRAESAAAQAAHGLRALELVMRTASEQVAITGRLDGLQPYLKRLTARLPTVRTVTIVDPDGIIRTDLRDGEPGKGIDVSDRAYFRAHLPPEAVSGYFYSPPIISRVDGRNQITLSLAARRPDGTLAGVVVSSLDGRFFGPLGRELAMHGEFGAVVSHADTRATYLLRQSSVDGRDAGPIARLLAAIYVPDTAVHRKNVAVSHTDLTFCMKLPAMAYLSPAARRVGQGVLLIVLVAGLCGALWWIHRRARRQSEAFGEKTRAMNHRLRSLYHSAPNAILTMDTEMRVVDLNRAAEEMFGWTPEEVKRLTLYDLLPGVEEILDGEPDVECMEEGHPAFQIAARTMRAVHRNGNLRKVSVSLSRIILDQGPAATAIIRDITELERKNEQLLEMSQELEEQARRAEEASEAKSHFLATMSHELRTPLNAIIGFSDMMQNEVMGPLNNPHYASYVGDIRSSGEHLLSLINDVLDLSRLENRGDALPIDPVDCRMAARDALLGIRAMAMEYGVRLRVSIQRGLPDMAADPRAVHQILLNLLSNAVKFSSRGGRVILKLERTDDGAIALSVEDEGCGIPADKLPLLGQAFQCLGGRSHVANESGLGLGLAISKRLASEMKGELVIESVEGKGTRVTLVMPVATLCPILVTA